MPSSVTEPTSTVMAREASGKAPRKPRADSAASCAVSTTRREGRVVSVRTAAKAPCQSVSTRRACTGAMASVRAGRSAAPSTPVTRALVTLSCMSRCTWSPARAASAESRSAASSAASSRVPSPTRAAAVRPVSTMRTTCRSRSGRQVRSIVVPARAVARQSMERTSSPRTYSRKESNSVPCPRTWMLVFPSSSRSRASREGRCLREEKAGSTRIAPRTGCSACRPASPRGPRERSTTKALTSSPRRLGRRGMSTRRRSPGGMRRCCRSDGAPAVGCHASRSRTSSVRVPRFCTATLTGTCSPSRARDGTRRVTVAARGSPARTTSTATRRRHSPIHPPSTAYGGNPASPVRTSGTMPTARATARRPETNT